MEPKQHHGGEEIEDLGSEDANAILTTGPGEAEGAGVDDDLEGGSTGAASMAGGDSRRATSPEARGGGSDAADARPGGQWNTGAAGAHAGEIGTSSVEPGPQGPGGGDRSAGAGSGSIDGAGYNNSGRLVGHDSPAGEGADTNVGGDGQGDDLANHLGGIGGRGAGMSGAGSVSGDLGPGGSEEISRTSPAGGIGGDPGGPGGMGGVRASTAGIGRPPGGVSPVQADVEGEADDR